MREFEYNKTIGHSECVVCGARFGIKKDRDTEPLIKLILRNNKFAKPIQDPYELIVDYISKRIDQLIKNKESAQGRVSELRKLQELIQNGSLKKAVKRLK